MRLPLRFALAALLLPGATASAQGTVTVRRVSDEDLDRWSVSLTLGRPVGGPTGAMKQKLLAEGWTDHYCDGSLTNCHENPRISSPDLSFTGIVTRRLRGRLETSLMLSYVNLGSAQGRLRGTDVEAEWSVMMTGVALSYRPFKRIRVGAGPLVSLLNSSTTGDTPGTIFRFGAWFEAGIRSSETKATFLDLSAAYRWLATRTEGPWPGARQGLAEPAGPSPLRANFSHFAVSLGFGWRFSS